MGREFSPNQQRVLNYMKEHGSITAKQIESIIDTDKDKWWAAAVIIGDGLRDGIFTMHETKDGFKYKRGNTI
jgi:hypothetical protein